MGKFRANKFMLCCIIYCIFISSYLFKFILNMLNISEVNSAITIFISSLVLNLVPFIMYLLLTKSSIKEVIPLKKLSFKSVILIILITIFSSNITSFITYITNIFFQRPVVTTIFEISRESSYFTMLLVVCITPAILEEILCRGIYLSSFKNESLIKSCIMCGIFFGILHFNWEQFFYATFMGIIFSLLVRITGSIYSSVLSHFFINGTSISTIFLTNFLVEKFGLTDYESLITNEQVTSISSIITLFTSAILSIFILKIFFKFLIEECNKDKPLDENTDLVENTNVKKKSFFDIYFIISVTLYLIYMLF